MHPAEDIKNCIAICWECRNDCQTAFFTHCIEKNGDHLKPGHVRLIADCIEMCQTAADAMVRQSPMHAEICEACAKICDACAESCEEIGCDEMKRCAEICRKCAESCREMSLQMRNTAAAAAAQSGEGRIMA